jgi:hypothetical protein
MSWKEAKYAATADGKVILVCCGDVLCFDGRGCATARWITQRLETTGYRLVRRPHLVEEPRV